MTTYFRECNVNDILSQEAKKINNKEKEVKKIDNKTIPTLPDEIVVRRIVQGNYPTESEIKRLVENGCDINGQDKNGNTALMLTAIYGRESGGFGKEIWLNASEILVEKKVDVDTQNIQGDTALMLACKKNDVQLVEYLLKNKANANIKNNENKTALDIAKELNLTKIISAIEHYNKKRGLVDYLKECNIEKKHPELSAVKKLLESGADINYQNKHGNTALMLSNYKGWSEISDFLISKNARTDITNIKGETAFTIEKRNSHNDIKIANKEPLDYNSVSL